MNLLTLASRTTVKWSLAGAFLGFIAIHPVIMIVSYLMASPDLPAGYSTREDLVVEALRAFSVSMLPWSLAFAISIGLVGLFYGRIKQAEEEKSKLIVGLQEALAKLKTLRGLLPICASCKKIRDDKGYWNQIETYISDHSKAEFSHSICPQCAKELYGDYYQGKV